MVNTFSWQYFNGSSWVTSPGANSHGYPEQYSGTGLVLIQAGQIIIADVNTAFPIGKLITNLQATLINSATIFLNSPKVIVNVQF